MGGLWHWAGDMDGCFVVGGRGLLGRMNVHVSRTNIPQSISSVCPHHRRAHAARLVDIPRLERPAD